MVRVMNILFHGEGRERLISVIFAFSVLKTCEFRIILAFSAVITRELYVIFAIITYEFGIIFGLNKTPC